MLLRNKSLSSIIWYEEKYNFFFVTVTLLYEHLERVWHEIPSVFFFIPSIFYAINVVEFDRDVIAG